LYLKAANTLGLSVCSLQS